MRVCFFGDSFVNGTGDDDGLGWPGRVIVAGRQAGLDLTCYNLGIRRDTSAGIAARWQDEARRRLPPDMPARLAFSFGTNDCATGEGGGPRIALAASLANARAILGVAARMAPTIMLGPPPVLGDPAADERIAHLGGDLAVLCAELGVPYLETFGFIQGCAAWRLEAARADGTHPGSEGYAALAAHILGWAPCQRWLGLTE